jgi:hypothetical protein
MICDFYRSAEDFKNFYAVSKNKLYKIKWKRPYIPSSCNNKTAIRKFQHKNDEKRLKCYTEMLNTQMLKNAILVGLPTEYRHECASKKVRAGTVRCNQWLEGFAT